MFPLFHSAFPTAATVARATLLAVAALRTTGRRDVADHSRLQEIKKGVLILFFTCGSSPRNGR